MKTLVIIAHPNMDNSKVNKVWRDTLSENDNITIRELYKVSKDGKFDIEKEQALLKEHDRIIYQFPFHWYAAPSLLKEWQDNVLTFGFSHGPSGDKLKGKEFMLVISAGGKDSAYRAGGYQNFSIDELTRPYQAMANFTGMKFLQTYTLYETHTLSEDDIHNSAKELLEILA